jgi:hypothetical protein
VDEAAYVCLIAKSVGSACLHPSYPMPDVPNSSGAARRRPPRKHLRLFAADSAPAAPQVSSGLTAVSRQSYSDIFRAATIRPPAAPQVSSGLTAVSRQSPRGQHRLVSPSLTQVAEFHLNLKLAENFGLVGMSPSIFLCLVCMIATEAPPDSHEETTKTNTSFGAQHIIVLPSEETTIAYYSTINCVSLLN